MSYRFDNLSLFVDGNGVQKIKELAAQCRETIRELRSLADDAAARGVGSQVERVERILDETVALATAELSCLRDNASGRWG